MCRSLLMLLAVLALILSVSAQSRSSSSSSSSALPLSSSSSFVTASSSTGSRSSSSSSSLPSATSTPSLTPGSTYPAGSYAISMVVNINSSITPAIGVPLLQNDIAFNVANENGIANYTYVVPYVQMTSWNGVTLAPSSRRLLQTTGSIWVNFIILGNISQLGAPITSSTTVVQRFLSAAQTGTLQTPNLATINATIPPQSFNAYSTDGSASLGPYTPSSSSSSASYYPGTTGSNCSSAAPSSTLSPSGAYPAGSYAVSIVFVLGSSNTTLLVQDLSYTYFGRGVNYTTLPPFVRVTSLFTVCGSSNTTVTYVVFGNITALGVTAAQVVQNLTARAAEGILYAPWSQSTVPAQTIAAALIVSPSSTSSSTGSADVTPTSIYPTGSFALLMKFDMHELFTAGDAAPLLQQDIAYNIANETGINATLIAPFVVITSYDGVYLAPSSRRLLQSTSSIPVTFIILGNISQLGAAVADTSAVVQKFKAAAAAGTLVAPNSGATIPVQTITISVPGAISSSTGYGYNGASPVASTSAALLIAAVASLALAFLISSDELALSDVAQLLLFS